MTVQRQADAQGNEVGGAPTLQALLEQTLDAPAQAPASAALTAAITATAYWSFPPNLEIVLARAERAPTDAQARSAFDKRLNRRPIPLVLIIEAPERTLVVGPGGTPPPVTELDPRLVADDLRQAAALDPVEVRQRLPRAFRRAQGGGGLTGLRNQGLFSTHYLKARVPRFAEWDELAATGRAATRARSVTARLDALGYAAEQRAEGIYLLRAEGRPAAAVLSYPRGRDLDVAGSGGELPVAGLLAEMEAAGTRWGILATGELWRLYDAEHPSRATSFVEVDAAKLAEPAYLAALFSAQALGGGTDGLASRIGEGSAAYGAELGDRLRGRVYQRVVPGLAAALADAAEREGIAIEGREGLTALYDATLTLLYRLLFVLYAEARDYLPLTTSDGYRAHSLAKRLEGVIATEREGRDYDSLATDIWSDLSETFHAVNHGQVEWGVPAYNGGLFRNDPDLLAGRILARAQPTNAGLGPALQRLAVDPDSEDSARIDYADLDIRRLGDIYEGLLQFELDRAREPLRYDSKLDAFVPAGDRAGAEVPAGGIYVRTRSGGRKASGSFYTPQFIVRHLVNEALVPALREHLEEVASLTAAGEEERAARKLWDFRVCDPAMGSGHFLVDALDVLTGEIARHLAEHPLRPVRAVLSQLREMVSSAAGELPAEALGELRDVDLLKRIVLKRCIYGVDRNRMAVELAKLGLWLEAFVPGLPLSYLDHSLKQGNSLIGVVGDEVQRALRPERATLEGDRIAEALATATEMARRAVETVELGLRDIKAAEAAERERGEALVEVRSLYDRWSAESFGLPGARERIGEEDAAEAEAAAGHARAHAFFHWPLELPEVFARERPGFDVVLANPPWEKMKVERHDFFQMRLPGLKFVNSAEERERLIVGLLQRSPEVGTEYEETIARVGRLKAYFQSGARNYRLHGGGDPDLFKAFAERFFDLVRKEGTLGCVLPRGLLAGAGAAALRRELFTRWTVLSADVLWNRRVWAFPDVFHRTRMTLLAARKTAPGKAAAIPSAGPLADLRTFLRARELRIDYALSDLEAWSPSLELPAVPDPESGAVFKAMLEHPRFDDEGRAWRAVPYTELHATGDSDLFNEQGEGWPVWKGQTFDRYRPDLAEPIYWAEPGPVLERLQRKRERSRGVFGEASPEALADPSTLPPHDCRLVFRDVTNSKNTRSMITCLAPPGVFAIHDAPQLFCTRGDERDMLYLLGLMNSLPFDWLLRRRVETHVTFSILNSLPVPENALHAERLADLAGRLSCVDERYADFADRVGLDHGLLSVEERREAEAEIDALVAHAYGLDAEQLRVVLRDFNERAVGAEQRERILDHHRRASTLAAA